MSLFAGQKLSASEASSGGGGGGPAAATDPIVANNLSVLRRDFAATADPSVEELVRYLLIDAEGKASGLVRETPRDGSSHVILFSDSFKDQKRSHTYACEGAISALGIIRLRQTFSDFAAEIGEEIKTEYAVGRISIARPPTVRELNEAILKDSFPVEAARALSATRGNEIFIATDGAGKILGLHPPGVTGQSGFLTRLIFDGRSLVYRSHEKTAKITNGLGKVEISPELGAEGAENLRVSLQSYAEQSFGAMRLFISDGTEYVPAQVIEPTDLRHFENTFRVPIVDGTLVRLFHNVTEIALKIVSSESFARLNESAAVAQGDIKWWLVNEAAPDKQFIPMPPNRDIFLHSIDESSFLPRSGAVTDLKSSDARYAHAVAHSFHQGPAVTPLNLPEGVPMSLILANQNNQRLEISSRFDAGYRIEIPAYLEHKFPQPEPVVVRLVD